MKKEVFGYLPTGEAVDMYLLQTDESSVEIITYGGAIRSFVAYGVSIVGGFDTLESYLKDDSHQGALIGRVANRIAGGVFTMDGKTYTLKRNSGKNCLHGGAFGFDSKLWTVEEYTDTSILLSYYSPDGEEGFPNGLSVKVRYTLCEATLMLEYEAIPDGKTPIALTNQSYFNLDGFGSTVCEHVVRMYADEYSEIDADMIPYANLPVKGTVFDFLEPHTIGERIGGDFIGYDHNFVLSRSVCEEVMGRSLPLATEVEGKQLKMKVYTDAPGMQFYIGNFLGNGENFSGGIAPIRHGAFCLEAQTEPNIINHGEAFYEAGEVYRQVTVYRVMKK